VRYRFEAELWRWTARRELWTFVSLPEEASEEIKEVVGDLAGGFQSVRVDAAVGASHWRTSIFPGTSGMYSLPIKKKVRDAEGLVLGEPLTVTVELVDF
jgi:hypothetical protein